MTGNGDKINKMKRHYRNRRDIVVVCVALVFAVIFAATVMFAVYDRKPRTLSKGGGHVSQLRAQDGDTLVAASGRHIRLLCIDAPETEQRHGNNAKHFLSELVRNGAAVQSQSKDQYGRALAIVAVTVNGGRLIANKEMLRRGHAWGYRRFSDDCGLDKEELLALEEEARAASRGLWRNNNPIPPWRWRQGKR